MQDTLYLHYGKQYLKDCYIEGSVDFIFGNSTALLEHCHIHCKAEGFITAQSRKSSQETTGYVFLRWVIDQNFWLFRSSFFGFYPNISIFISFWCYWNLLCKLDFNEAEKWNVLEVQGKEQVTVGTKPLEMLLHSGFTSKNNISHELKQ